MYFVFAGACFVGAACAAAFYVLVLGNHDPKFGAVGSLGVQLPFLFLASVAPLVGFAIASRTDARGPSFTISGGLISGAVAYGLLLALGGPTVSPVWTFGVPLVWLFVAGFVCGRTTREHTGSRP
jgi:hypothetical protein